MAKRKGLGARSSAVRAAMTAGRDKDAPQGKPVSQTIRLDPDRHDALRTIAFNERRSMHSLLVEGVDMVLRKHSKA